MLFVAALALLSGGAPVRRPQFSSKLVASAVPQEESLVADELSPKPPSTLLLCTTVALQVSCFGVIAQALPVALMDPAIGGHSSVSAAKVLGTLASASALVELLVSGFFGRLSDAVGRKSTLVLVPLVAVLSERS